jgi:uncharacterized protein (DUF488 family)
VARTALHTIGYEKASFPAFIDTLRTAGVQHVIDVRDLPLSRRAGFSKTPLRNGLAESGIGYTHLKPLGTPPEGREASKRRQWPAFWQIVESRLRTPEARHALHDAIALAAERPSALLCYEADACTCHRLRVGQMMCEVHDFALVHLSVQTL